MKKSAETAHPLHPLLAERWSPVGFSEEPVAAEQLGSLLEAARWAPSSYNEQPWRLILARRSDGEAREAMEAAIVPANLTWCALADLLILVCARQAFARNGKPNRHAAYDCGQAIAMMSVQAQAMGLITHQMAGFDPQRARELLAIPEGFEPLTLIAVGHPAAAEDLPEALRERDRAPRSRRALAEIAFGGRFGGALP